MTGHLSGALSASSWQERERRLSPAYELAAALDNGLALTDPLDTMVRYFHSRPLLVLDTYRFTDALVVTNRDPAVRALPPVGAIDQYVDNTNATYHCSAAVTSQAPDLTGDPTCTDGCQTVLLMGSCRGGRPRGLLLHHLQQATRPGRPDLAAQAFLYETPTALDSWSDRPVQDPYSRLPGQTW